MRFYLASAVSINVSGYLDVTLYSTVRYASTFRMYVLLSSSGLLDFDLEDVGSYFICWADCCISTS